MIAHTRLTKIRTISTDVNKAAAANGLSHLFLSGFQKPKVRQKPVVATIPLPMCSNRKSNKLYIAGICHLPDLLPNVLDLLTFSDAMLASDDNLLSYLMFVSTTSA